MAGQRGFWDVEERLKELSAEGDPLEKLGATVDFEMFRPVLRQALGGSHPSKGGRPGFDPCPLRRKTMALKKFMIERGIPKVGALDAEQLSGAAAKSNDALCHIGAKDIQWVHSYVTADKTFCVYLPSDEGAIKRHAELSGFPADKITEIVEMIDPATAR